MAFSTIFGGLALADVVCMNAALEHTVSIKIFRLFGWHSLPDPADRTIGLQNQQAGIRRLQQRQYMR